MNVVEKNENDWVVWHMLPRAKLFLGCWVSIMEANREQTEGAYSMVSVVNRCPKMIPVRQDLHLRMLINN